MSAALVRYSCLFLEGSLSECIGLGGFALLPQHDGLFHAGCWMARGQLQGSVQVRQGLIVVATLALKSTQSACMQSFVCSFIHSFTHSLTHSLTHSFIHSFIHPSIHPSINPSDHPCIVHPSIHLFIYTIMHSSIRTFIHTIMHTSISSFIRSCIHPQKAYSG